MSNIDWDFINGQKERMLHGRNDLITIDERAAAPEFTDEDIASAVAKVEALPAVGDDADEIATFWPVKTWALSDLDFRDVEIGDTNLADLSASNADLSRKKLIWHVQNPGEAKGDGIFDAHPIVLVSKNYSTIIDGQHRLAALMLLDVTTWPVYLVPK